LEIKFGLLLEKAKSLGADYLATGHYAINEYDQKSKGFLLKRGVDESKDQSYFLYRLNQDVLPYILFPLGKFKKNQTRELAKKYGLKNYKKAESQEICFIQDDNYRKFLTQHIKDTVKPGKFIDKEGKILGDHQGIPFYTIGQRKGLGVSLNKRMYVTEINFHKNVIILSDDKDLYKDKLLVKDLSFISGDKLSNSIKAEVKIRYNSKKSPANISPYGEDNILISFEKPQRAVTPGQSAVFYQGDVVVGGGIIER
jgi:tRNA-specific 2-thiouridylase